MMLAAGTSFKIDTEGILVQIGLIPLLVVVLLAVVAAVWLRYRSSSRHNVRLTEVKAKLPFDIGELTFEIDERQRNAAWELYVELTTRIAVQKLSPDEGLVREALSSLYSLFETTRDVLRRAGPLVGASKGTVGGLAIAVLNVGLRPFLARWHPVLQDWEQKRPEGRSPREHEGEWDQRNEIREELDRLRSQLRLYAYALASIAGVSSDMT